MLWFVYDIFLLLAGILLMPALLLKMKRRGGYRKNFRNRFGLFSKEQLHSFQPGGSIWIHAASVGEVGVAFQFMEALRKDHADARFTLSVTSSTGYQTALSRISKADALIYCPIDFPLFTGRALDAIRPTAFVMVETEIWPNLIRGAAARSIPMAIINARISDKSAASYRRLRFLFGPALRKINLILAQSALDANRFVDAGAYRPSIQVTGSFKFDVARRNPSSEAAWIKVLEGLSLLHPTLL